MRILHIETGMNLYGGALQVLYLLRGLHQQGSGNILVCPEGSEIARAAAPYAEVRALPMRGELDLLFGARLVRLVKTAGPDLIHVHSRRGADLWGALAARLTRNKALVTRRVDNPEPGWLARLKYRQFAHVVTISEGIRRVLLKEGVASGHVSCVHSAVDLDAWQQPCDVDWFRQEFGLPEDARAVGVIAQLIPRKGHRFLIEAVPRILTKVPGAHFLFFGKGPLETDLRGLCEKQGMGDRFVFAGFREDLSRIVPCLDLVVHPALMEGLGVSLLQAAAAGVPIVGAGAGGIPEIVRDSVNGYLVSPGDAAALIDPVTRLLTDAELAAGFGEAGRRIVEERFSIEAMVAGNLEIYRQLANQ